MAFFSIYSDIKGLQITCIIVWVICLILLVTWIFFCYRWRSKSEEKGLDDAVNDVVHARMQLD